jgi:sugar phosphate permease
VKRIAKFRYVILGVLCLMYFISYIDRVNISVAGPIIRKEWNLSQTELGFVISAFAYPYAAMQIFGGWLADKFGPRLILTVLSVIWGLATLLCGLVTALPALLVLRVLLGVGEGGAFPTATRAFTYWMPVTERGLAQGLTHSFSRLGGALAPLVVVAIVLARGWRASFVLLGVASLGWTVLWLLVFRNTPAEHRWVKKEELAEIGVDAAGMRTAAKEATPWRSMIARMWLVTLVDFCYGWALWVFLAWLPSYLKEARGFDDHDMALFASFPLLAGVVGDTLGGVLSDLILKRTKSLKWARSGVLSAGLFGALVFILPATFVHDAKSAVAFLSLSFFCLELTNGVLWSLPIDIAVKYAGTAGGMMNSGFGIAGMISPVLFGYLLQKTGRYEVPFGLTAVLLLVGAVMATFVDPTKHVAGAGELVGKAD